MADVIDLDSRRPHLVLDTRGFGDNTVRVVPVAFLLDYAQGKPLSEDPPRSMLRLIVAEWLRCLDEHAGLEDCTDVEAEGGDDPGPVA